MFCSISGEVPEEPVVTRTGGVLYEKRLIEKYISDQGKCPITGSQLNIDDLMPVQVNKALRPRPISGTSIPGLLSAFQNEWDEVMLETFTLKQHLDTTRQELAQSLYQHDAACRVIARLMQERDEARQLLSQLQASGFTSSSSNGSNGSSTGTVQPTTVEMTVAADESESGAVSAAAAAAAAGDGGPQLDAAVVDKLGATCSHLSAGRKARKTHGGSAGASKEMVQSLACVASHTPHKADSKSGVTCVAVHSQFPAVAVAASSGGGRGKAAKQPMSAESGSEGGTMEVILSGGTDKNVLLTELASGRVLAKLTGHTKKVTDVAFLAPPTSTATADSSGNGEDSSSGSGASSSGKCNTLVSGSADKTVRVWTAAAGSADYTDSWVYKEHSSEIHSLCAHPSADYVISIAHDSWHFLDVVHSQCLQTQTMVSSEEGFTCGSLHPDGIILGTGSDQGMFRIWDIRTRENPNALSATANTTATTAAALSCVAFSENGYLAATGSVEGTVCLWDLRKLVTTQNLALGEGSSVSSLAFDSSGVFLAIAGGAGAGAGAGAQQQGTGLQVRVVKDWSLSVELNGVHTKPIQTVAWTPASKSPATAATLVSGGMDRSIKVFQPPSANV
mmetsp:Transcript_1430/g.2334  ORF Transcript_1430/g.2334 Transcript_1430/m.2334 type:complete len:619 (+) Transcript_1430:167-2023(+)